jgi:hypothetical protein
MKNAHVMLGLAVAGLMGAGVVSARQGAAPAAAQAPAQGRGAGAPARGTTPAQPAPIPNIPTDAIAGTATTPGNPWLPEKKAGPTSPALSAEEEMKTFSVPPGYHVELVAAEPLIESPILMDFDAEGRIWALELKSFMPDDVYPPRNLPDPINNVVVLEDTNGDGKMDKRTVFAEGLVMPRALKVLDQGVLVGEPPNLWLMKDTNGDLKADTKVKIVETYGTAGTGIEHKANSLFWALDNIMYSSEHTQNLRFKNGKFESLPGDLERPVAGLAGRCGPHLPERERLAALRGLHAGVLLPAAIRTVCAIGVSTISSSNRWMRPVYPLRPNRGVNRGYRDPLFRKDGSSIVIQGTSGPVIYRGDKYPANMRVRRAHQRLARPISCTRSRSWMTASAISRGRTRSRAASSSRRPMSASAPR